MARPSKFTDDDILGAAAQLKEAGKEVTGYALSTALEGGRPSSLAERFLELTAAKAPVEPLPALPQATQTLLSDIAGEIQKKLVDELTQVHADLEKQSFARVAAIETKAQADVEKFKAELDEAVELLGTEKDRAIAAEDALKAAQEQITLLRTELAQKAGELDAMKRSHDELTSKLLSKLDQLNTATKAKA